MEALGFGPIPEDKRGLYICCMIRGERLCTTDFDVVRSVTFIERGRLIENSPCRFMKDFGADMYTSSRVCGIGSGADAVALSVEGLEGDI